MKKIFLSIFLSLVCICPIQATSDSDYPDKDNCIIDVQNITVYFNLDTNKQITEENALSLSSNQLFTINIKHTLFQKTNGIVSLGINMSATNAKCQIKKISGTFKVSDTSTYASSVLSISTENIVPTYRLGGYYQGTHSFSKGHTVKATANYYIYLTNGSVLNGGNINYSNTLKIVR